MKYSLFRISIAILVTGLSTLPVMAQEAQTSPGIESITIIAHMVRWSGVLASLLVIVSAWLLISFVDRMVANLGNIFAERRLLLQKLSAFFHFGVYLITIVTVVLLSFKISREVLAILGGTAAVAIGFALKDLVASMVAGVMIMIDRPFQVGDRVTFGGQYGDITAIGLRSVKLQTLDDNTVTIPNNLFLSQIASSGNYGALDMQVVIDFHIGVDQDARLAQDLVREASATSRYVYLPKPIVVRVSQVIIDHYVALRLRLKIYVLDTKYEKAFVSDVTLRVLDAFEAEGIRPPAILHRNMTDDDGRVRPQAVRPSGQGC
jgi:small-conductance mechanosensitive channel